MDQYKIYVGDKPFFIVATLTNKLKQLASTHGTLMLNQPDAASLGKVINDLEKSQAKAAIVLTSDMDHVLSELKRLLTYIQAGGGLVRNHHNEYLFIYRRNKWDLPKGKLDDGETIEQCAIREVQEETGLNEVDLEEVLLHTWHIYHGFGQHVIKETTWFKMSCPINQLLTPQVSEDISKTVWFKKEDWGDVLKSTFPSVRDVLMAV